MKAILVIDMPSRCADCRLKRGLFCGESGNSLYDYIHNDDSINDKPCWCPLKPIPCKLSEIGLELWNSTAGQILAPKGLFDEILGGTNE